jgi:hypothetical protein
MNIESHAGGRSAVIGKWQPSGVDFFGGTARLVSDPDYDDPTARCFFAFDCLFDILTF